MCVCLFRGQRSCWTRSTEESAELCPTYRQRNSFLSSGWKTVYRPNRRVTSRIPNFVLRVCVCVCSREKTAYQFAQLSFELLQEGLSMERLYLLLQELQTAAHRSVALSRLFWKVSVASVCVALAAPSPCTIWMHWCEDLLRCGVCFSVQGCLCLPGSDSGGISARRSERTWSLHSRSAPVSFRAPCVCVCGSV